MTVSMVKELKNSYLVIHLIYLLNLQDIVDATSKGKHISIPRTPVYDKNVSCCANSYTTHTIYIHTLITRGKLGLYL